MDSVSVLVVEDNPTNLKLVCALLAIRGISVLTATTAAQGIQLAQDHLPALVLLDIQLPDRDGTYVLGELRHDPRTAHIPVVAVTASAMKGDRERLLAGGFNGYLPKPIEISSFVEHVAAMLRPASPGPASS